MENIGKKRRLEVKKEPADHETTRAFKIFNNMYHCFSCSRPLKPPVFECRNGHRACTLCFEYHTGSCGWCATKYKHIPWLDPYLMATKVPCPNKLFGCGSSVAYCLVEDHRLGCPHPPCCCPNCDFRGSSWMLWDHLKMHHDWLVTSIAFDENLGLKIHEAERWRLLATEKGEHLFLLVISEAGGGGRGIRVVHVRGKDEGPWRYCCKVWTNPPVDPENGSTQPISYLEDRVRSCAVPSEAAAMAVGGRHLSVHLLDMLPGGGGFALDVRITRYQLQTAEAVSDLRKLTNGGYHILLSSI